MDNEEKMAVSNFTCLPFHLCCVVVTRGRTNVKNRQSYLRSQCLGVGSSRTSAYTCRDTQSFDICSVAVTEEETFQRTPLGKTTIGPYYDDKTQKDLNSLKNTHWLRRYLHQIGCPLMGVSQRIMNHAYRSPFVCPQTIILTGRYINDDVMTPVAMPNDVHPRPQLCDPPL